MLIADETGQLKQGQHTMGVARQYTGTAGKIDNAQVAVYLTYASRHGHGLVDRELYLPECWTQDADRRAAAGVAVILGQTFLSGLRLRQGAHRAASDQPARPSPAGAGML